MADFMKILQQAQQMQGRLQEIQDQLQQQTVTGTAGGGMVRVEADGKGQVRRITLDPSVVSAADVEMLEDLIVVAVTDAQKKAASLAQEEMGKLTGGLQLPFRCGRSTGPLE
jgi:DNA-binding YbaB/EbfC family protein